MIATACADVERPLWESPLCWVCSVARKMSFPERGLDVISMGEYGRASQPAVLETVHEPMSHWVVCEQPMEENLTDNPITRYEGYHCAWWDHEPLRYDARIPNKRQPSPFRPSLTEPSTAPLQELTPRCKCSPYKH